MDGIGIFVAFLAGIVSFASPCCLPLVPVFVSYMVGTSEPDSPAARWVALRQATVFVLGFSAVFIALWASVGLVGYALRGYTSLLREVGGVALIVLGLHVAGLIDIPALYRERRLNLSRVGGGTAPGPNGVATVIAPSYPRSALLGVAFAAGWTPCIGPILGGIIGLASVSSSVAAGTLLLGVYALGLGLPFILVAVGATVVQEKLSWFRRHAAGVSLVSGAMLVIVGFLMFTNLFVRLSGYLPQLGI
jgi:cytochrome c-type biogenesis protein